MKGDSGVSPERAAGGGSGSQHELVDLAFDAVFTRGFTDRVITSWNQGAERLYGWTRQEAIGRQPADLLGSRYPMPLEEIEADLLRTGRWEGDIVQRRKDGSALVVACRWGLQTDAQGRPNAILEINSDLTTHRDAAEQLALTEERFSLLVSAMVDYAIFMLDPSGLVVSWNEGAQRIKGYRADEIIGRSFSTFYAPEDVARGKPARALAMATEHGRYEDEGWRLRKDGTRFWASVVITALRDRSGRLRGFGKVTRDITAKRDEQERLREHARRTTELERSKTQFLDLAAHELRGPLTLIRGYNSMLQEGVLPAERIPEIARLLEERLSQIDLMVDQMLEMGRLENDRLELRLRPVDLKDVTARQVARARPFAPKHGLRLLAADDAVMAKGDAGRIETIVANLIDNAIKYSPAGGDVECVVGRSDGQVFVSVRDQGVGIAPEHMPLLFKRFGRLPTSTNKTIRGTGLALYLCQEIAQRHGGEVSVESAPNQGSEFTLRLPALAS